MKYFIGKRCITPTEPVMQCGFAARTQKSEGVHDALYATLLLLQDDKQETVVLISLDVLYGDRGFAEGIRAALKTQLDLEQVIINYAHTHGSVMLSGEETAAADPENGVAGTDGFPWSSGEKAADRRQAVAYYRRIRGVLLDLAREGLASLTDGRVFLCHSQSYFGVSRRYPLPDGSVAWRPYDNRAAMDPDLYLLRCENSAGQLTGLVYQYACHPTTLGADNNLITADYPGAVRRLLEQANPGLTVLFLQGCGADIKPRATADGDHFKSCTFAEMEAAASGLADEIQACLEKGFWRQLDLDLAFACCSIRLFAEIWRAEQWQALLDDPAEPAYIKHAINGYTTSPEKRSRHLPFELSVLRLDRQTCLVALENEVVHAYGRKIKALFAQDVLVLGYSNSCQCYIPSRRVLREGGYECDSFKRTNLTGPFTPETEDILVGRAASLISDDLYGYHHLLPVDEQRCRKDH